MKRQEEYKAWNQLHIEILDIRLHTLAPREASLGYLLPASALLFPYRGKAKVWMDKLLHPVEHFHFFHGCKGTRLDIEAEEHFEYYLVLYRAELPVRRRLSLVHGELLPFQQVFGFSPLQPLLLYPIIQRMEEEWRRSTEKEKLRVKALFYQFIVEMLQQKQQQGLELLPAEVVKQAVQYMLDHVEQPVTLEILGQKFGYNSQYLARKFKGIMGRSPIDYLIGLRIDKACSMLRHTDASIGDIARSVGYEDLFYFTRIFKKNVGLSPSHYKKKMLNETDVRFSPYKGWTSSMVKSDSLYYSNDVNDNHYHYKEEGDFNMYKTSRMNVAVTVLLGLTLLLTACGGGNSAPPTQSGVASTSIASSIPSNANSNASTTQEAAPAAATKIVNTAFGEVEVPVKPERIAAIQYLSGMLAVKASPIASTTRILENPYFSGLTDHIEIVGASGSEVSLEKLVDLEPDLIVVMTSKKEEVETFSKIAPTIGIPYGSFATIEEEVTFFGDLLGRKDEASAWLTDYAARMAAAKAKVMAVIPADATFSIIEVTDKNLSVFGKNYGRGGKAIYEIFERLAPASYAAEIMEENYREISMEVLEEYAGDYIILTTDKSLEEIRGDKLWGKLDAVKKDRLYVWPNKKSYFTDPLSVLSQTEDLAEWLTRGEKNN
ncbi:AraC family transcriptional regulator [Paenibacillus eucommiae]|uniref:Iron complex transport system substrate-binding protein n=1 Tax=Paenibacillus eucommiae TaxID=1355755 RepID=A0ABS4IVW4_9BACL|nr:AraC family transcriptional regulator [Paenibacillus eucommiae]MBP1991730.1 iron complex transport system substrate-binding protein [Paenibacillus eucommiae]